jgi:6-phospho-beta-glucosidase
MRNVTLSGGGIRTPLIIHGLAQAQHTLDISEVALYDIDRERLSLLAALAQEAARQIGSGLKITTPATLAEAVSAASFIIHSISWLFAVTPLWRSHN